MASATPPTPESPAARALSLILIGPDSPRRRRLGSALVGSHSVVLREFGDYLSRGGEAEIGPRECDAVIVDLDDEVENGLKVTETTFEEAALAKGESRRRDAELIRTGKATPEQIQKKNSISAGPFRVVDYSPLFSALDEAKA